MRSKPRTGPIQPGQWAACLGRNMQVAALTEEHTKGIDVCCLGQNAIHQQLWRHVCHSPCTGSGRRSLPSPSAACTRGMPASCNACRLPGGRLPPGDEQMWALLCPAARSEVGPDTQGSVSSLPGLTHCGTHQMCQSQWSSESSEAAWTTQSQPPWPQNPAGPCRWRPEVHCRPSSPVRRTPKLRG